MNNQNLSNLSEDELMTMYQDLLDKNDEARQRIAELGEKNPNASEEEFNQVKQEIADRDSLIELVGAEVASRYGNTKTTKEEKVDVQKRREEIERELREMRARLEQLNRLFERNNTGNFKRNRRTQQDLENRIAALEAELSGLANTEDLNLDSEKKESFADKVRGMDNQELLERREELLEEYRFRAQMENGLEQHDADSFMEELQAVLDEIQRRNVDLDDIISRMSDEELKAREEELLEEYNFRAHMENGMEEHLNDTMMEELSKIQAEIKKRNPEEKKEETSGLVQDEPKNDNRFASMSDEELKAKEEELLDEYNFRAHMENGMEEHPEDDHTLEDLAAVRNEIKNRQDKNVETPENVNPYANMSDEELKAKEEELLDEYNFRAHMENGMEEHLEDDHTLEDLAAVRNEIKNRQDRNIETPKNVNPDGNINDEELKPKEEVPESTPTIPDVSSIEPGTIPFDAEEYAERYQDMLDKYYGNKNKKKEYKERLARFKSHVVDKDGVKFVEEYEEKAEDEKFLQLEEYSYRIERYSKAELGDYSGYMDMVDRYRAAMAGVVDATGVELSEEEIINKLRGEDEDYIRTNNQAYNQHQATQENLKTLGKHGEKVPYFAFAKVKKDVLDEEGNVIDSKIDPKAIAANIGRGAVNIAVFGRNIKGSINKAIGNYIAAPIHRVLFDSEKMAKGMYEGKASHRYQARKNYFEQEMISEMMLKQQQQIEEGLEPKNPGIGFAIKLAFAPRLKSIFKAKEGNQKVLAAGAHDIKESMEEIAKQQIERQYVEDVLVEARGKLLGLIKTLEEKGKTCENSEERKAIGIQIAETEDLIKRLDKKREANANLPVNGVVQTDAISMAVHDKANKANMTIAITAIKTAGRLAVGHFVGKNITKHIEEQAHYEQTPDTIGYTEKIVPAEYDEVHGLSEQSLENLKVSDAMSAQDATLQYARVTGREIATPTNATIPRGMAFVVDGKEYSGTDGIGYSIKGISAVQIDKLSGNEGLLETAAQIMTAQGTPTTKADLIAKFANNPSAFNEFCEGFRMWASISDKGIATGWKETADSILKNVDEFVTKVEVSPASVVQIPYTIPGQTIKIVDVAAHEVINPGAVIGEAVLAGGEAVDIYDLLRRTRGSEELVAEGVRTRTESHQKENKGLYSERNTENDWGLTGDKKGDYDSLYSEEELLDELLEKDIELDSERIAEIQEELEEFKGRGI